MKLLSLCLAAVLCLSAAASAQSVTSFDPTAVQIGSMTVNTNLQSRVLGKRKNISHEVLIMRSATGMIEYAIVSPSIRLDGDASDLDSTSTPDLYSAMAQSTLDQGIVQGYAASSTPAVVLAESCVTRTGSGVDTRFVPCDTYVYVPVPPAPPATTDTIVIQ